MTSKRTLTTLTQPKVPEGWLFQTLCQNGIPIVQALFEKKMVASSLGELVKFLKTFMKHDIELRFNVISCYEKYVEDSQQNHISISDPHPAFANTSVVPSGNDFSSDPISSTNKDNDSLNTSLNVPDSISQVDEVTISFATKSIKPHSRKGMGRFGSGINTNTTAKNNNITTSLSIEDTRKKKMQKIADKNTGLLAQSEGSRAVFASQKPNASKNIRKNKELPSHRISIMPTQQELETFQKYLPKIDPLHSVRQELQQKYESRYFADWAWRLQCGSNILTYGEGSQKTLLTNFWETWLMGEDIIESDCTCVATDPRQQHHLLWFTQILDALWIIIGGARREKYLQQWKRNNPSVTSSHVTAGWIGGSPLHEAKVISEELNRYYGYPASDHGLPWQSGDSSWCLHQHCDLPFPEEPFVWRQWMEGRQGKSSSSRQDVDATNNDNQNEEVTEVDKEEEEDLIEDSTTDTRKSNFNFNFVDDNGSIISSEITYDESNRQYKRSLRSRSRGTTRSSTGTGEGISIENSSGQQYYTGGGRYALARGKVYIVLHELGGSRGAVSGQGKHPLNYPKKEKEAHEALAILARLSPAIRYIASIDHIDVSCLWDSITLQSFNWSYYHVPTFDTKEISPDFYIGPTKSKTKSFINASTTNENKVDAVERISINCKLSSLPTRHMDLLQIISLEVWNNLKLKKLLITTNNNKNIIPENKKKSSAVATGDDATNDDVLNSLAENEVVYKNVLKQCISKLVIRAERELEKLLKELIDQKLVAVGVASNKFTRTITAKIPIDVIQRLIPSEALASTTGDNIS